MRLPPSWRLVGRARARLIGRARARMYAGVAGLRGVVVPVGRCARRGARETRVKLAAPWGVDAQVLVMLRESECADK